MLLLLSMDCRSFPWYPTGNSETWSCIVGFLDDAKEGCCILAWRYAILPFHPQFAGFELYP